MKWLVILAALATLACANKDNRAGETKPSGSKPSGGKDADHQHGNRSHHGHWAGKHGNRSHHGHWAGKHGNHSHHGHGGWAKCKTEMAALMKCGLDQANAKCGTTCTKLPEGPPKGGRRMHAPEDGTSGSEPKKGSKKQFLKAESCEGGQADADTFNSCVEKFTNSTLTTIRAACSKEETAFDTCKEAKPTVANGTVAAGH